MTLGAINSGLRWRVLSHVPDSKALSIFVPGEVVAKARARVTRAGHAYTPEKTKRAESELKSHFNYICREDWPLPALGPLKVSICFSLIKPKHSRKRVYPTTRPDLDNYLKLVLDAGNGLLWRDDSLVVKVVMEKVYSDKEGIHLTLEEL